MFIKLQIVKKKKHPKLDLMFLISIPSSYTGMTGSCENLWTPSPNLSTGPDPMYYSGHNRVLRNQLGWWGSSVGFANPCTNTHTTADFRLPRWGHWMWSWEEMSTCCSSRPIGVAPGYHWFHTEDSNLLPHGKQINHVLSLVEGIKKKNTPEKM